MHDDNPAGASAGPRLTRRALIEGGVALGLAAGGLTRSVHNRVRARAMQDGGGDDWGGFDRAIEAAAQQFGIVGTAVAVVNSTGIVHQHAFGVRDLATGSPVSPSTLFRVAPTPQAVSALLVAQFGDEGRLGGGAWVRA